MPAEEVAGVFQTFRRQITVVHHPGMNRNKRRRCSTLRCGALAEADPKLVRIDRLRAKPQLDSVDGVYGDPSKSSAELGKLGVDEIVSHTVAAINAAVAQR